MRAVVICPKDSIDDVAKSNLEDEGVLVVETDKPYDTSIHFPSPPPPDPEEAMSTGKGLAWLGFWVGLSTLIYALLK